MSIWSLVALAIIIVLVAILVFRLHALLTLLFASWLISILTPIEALESFANSQVLASKFTEVEAQGFVTSSAVDRVLTAFGETAGKIGVLIALASVIGAALLKSGAASVIVDSILKWTGPKRAPEALAASSFVLGIPVFFDTVFYLMIPLAQSLQRRMGKNYVLFILSILAGGSIAHSLIPPTPGPLQVASIIGVDVGTMLLAGLVIGSLTSVLSLFAARLINSRLDLPMSDQEATEAKVVGTVEEDGLHSGEESVDRSDIEPPPRPSLFASLLPIVIPVVLIAIGSIIRVAGLTGPLAVSVGVIADKNVAIAIGCVLSLRLLRGMTRKSRESLISSAITSGGGIILITSAGGAFGSVLRQAGIAAAIADFAKDVPGLWLLPLAFLVTAAIRTLQGSATVAMITAAGVLQGFAHAGDLPFHPVYLAMAIGAGSKPVSWMTDSAFWVITKVAGMSEEQGLRTISPMSTAMGLSALLVTVIAAAVFPAV